MITAEQWDVSSLSGMILTSVKIVKTNYVQVSQRKLPSSLNSLSSRPSEGSDQLLLHVQVGQPGNNTIFGVPYSIYYVSVWSRSMSEYLIIKRFACWKYLLVEQKDVKYESMRRIRVRVSRVEQRRVQHTAAAVE